MMARALFLVVVLASAAAVGCGRIMRDVRLVPDPAATIAELWQEPDDLGRRNLYYGPGGLETMPRDTTFTFVARDTSGWSPGFDVRDGNSLEWSVKLGPEAQSEVVASRILWAMGFHQPPIYYLDQWALTGAESGPQPAGRFRPSLTDQKVVGDWSWYENPFVGTRQYAGLIAANVILTNWDWKNTNTRIYEFATPRNDVRRWYVVRDLGASLGRFTYPRMLEWTRLRGFGQGTKNDLVGFEQQPFLVADGDRFTIDYRGIYGDLVKSVALADIRWTCELLARLSDQQWHDAFRAAGYPPEHAARYVKKLKEKVAQGLALPAAGSTAQ